MERFIAQTRDTDNADGIDDDLVVVRVTGCDQGCAGGHSSDCNVATAYLYTDGSVCLRSAADFHSYASVADAAIAWGPSPERARDSDNEWDYVACENAIAQL